MTEAEWLACDDPTAMLGAFRNNGPDWVNLTPLSARKLRLFACAVSRLGIASVRKGERADWRIVVADAEAYADGRIDAARMARHSRWTLGIVTDAIGVALAILTDAALVRHQPECAALLRCVAGNPFRPVRLKRTVSAKCPRCCGSGTKWRKGVIEVASGSPSRPGGMAECVWCKGTGWRSKTADPDWLTPTVLSLAQAAYDERPGRRCSKCFGNPYYDRPCDVCQGAGTIDDGALDHARLAVLSDALEEAGCPTPAGCGVCFGSGVLCRTAGPDAPDDYRECHECALLAHLRSSAPHVRGCWALDLLLGKE